MGIDLLLGHGCIKHQQIKTATLWRDIMRGGYESLIWLKDKSGKEYVCYLDEAVDHDSFEKLSEEQKRKCADVNQLVGTERW
jgi:hypothetical protein